ncbi:hypothetical protein L1887_51535 [Cichorium endivia]|nr:hypothetical protein L1887_51535 [Cichorium endivia]
MARATTTATSPAPMSGPLIREDKDPSRWRWRCVNRFYHHPSAFPPTSATASSTASSRQIRRSCLRPHDGVHENNTVESESAGCVKCVYSADASRAEPRCRRRTSARVSASDVVGMAAKRVQSCAVLSRTRDWQQGDRVARARVGGGCAAAG